MSQSAEGEKKTRVIVGISGASGAVYGVRTLEALRSLRGYESHLVVSRAARATLADETGLSLREVEALADVVHAPGNVGATIASGSFPALGMIVAPCSVKTLSAIAYGHTDDLLSRAADVQLKEGRPVVLLLRETPLHLGHLRAMVAAAENGAVLMPPVPAFYARPKTIDDVVANTVGRALARLGVPNDLASAWQGLGADA